MLSSIRDIADHDLRPLVTTIDADGLYPGAVLRSLGKAGAFGLHLPGEERNGSILDAIRAMAVIGESCLSTAFCMWCQNALGWYIACSDNESLKQGLGVQVARGEVLGGTALSNPIKHFFGIEPIHLKGQRVPGGFRIHGSLPWVSNLAEDHQVAVVFEDEDAPGQYVMAVLSCGTEGLVLGHGQHFLALNGTGTCSIHMTDVFVPDALVLADPMGEYLRRIRAGFILLQTGMAFGLVQNLVEVMLQMRDTHGHVNRFLPEQPEDLLAQAARLWTQVEKLAATPFETSPDYFREVVEARLQASEISLSAAQAGMLHQGARGYLACGVAQRRLREAYFVAIVTPAMKQLRKMLDAMSH